MKKKMLIIVVVICVIGLACGYGWHETHTDEYIVGEYCEIENNATLESDVYIYTDDDGEDWYSYLMKLDDGTYVSATSRASYVQDTVSKYHDR